MRAPGKIQARSSRPLLQSDRRFSPVSNPTSLRPARSRGIVRLVTGSPFTEHLHELQPISEQLRTRHLGPPAPRLGTRLRTGVKLLVVVEGQHDVTFLRVISRTLHADDAILPDLGKLERAGAMVMLPIGGGDLLAWAARMAALGLPEFHLLDREVPPATERRQQAVEIVNDRPNCRAYVTQKRALENYLHPLAVQEVSSLDLTFGDDDDVADLVARACFERQDHELTWKELPGRARKRCRETAKRWLNRQAVERMTPGLLDERDPDGEVRGWLVAVAEIVIG